MVIILILFGVLGGLLAAGFAALYGFGILAIFGFYVLGGGCGILLMSVPVLLCRKKKSPETEKLGVKT